MREPEQKQPSTAPIRSDLGTSAVLERVLFEVKRVVVGQDLMIERMLVGLLARGHVLLEGVPGVAKTLAVRTLADAVGGSFARLQFTPDLMPSDIVGTRVWRPSAEQFDTELGPVFANLVLADEINRAPAKVQSALLEAMAERQVSIGGTSHRLPDPFLVLATQNPIESDGVYRLPEAQRDRFLLKVDVGHVEELEEMTIIQRMGTQPPRAEQILDAAALRHLQSRADQVFVHHAVAQYAVKLVMATRTPHAYGLRHLESLLAYGVSARGSLGLITAGRALALLRGRDYVLPGDVADLAGDILAHRLVLTFDAEADGVDPRAVVDAVLAVVPQPRATPSDDDFETAEPTPDAELAS
ncbi:AAA family ATPase [Nocardioides sp. NPDC101246]|uniref:AAA family ATPase n=1 Tax=Nocardioides sp. NPDC101246 TaxID=3364336 RepID=UPI00382BBDE9